MNIEFRKWNSETDVLVNNAPAFLSESDNEMVRNYSNWAYSINTSVGLFRKATDKDPTDQETSLILENGKEFKCVMENVSVWATRYYKDFFLFSSLESYKIYLIDSRGIIFELPCLSKSGRYDNGRGNEISIDKREGCYIINNVKVYYRTPVQQKVFLEKSSANENATLNKKFNAFCRNNAHNETGYLYLTAGNNKCGTLVSYFASKGMKYEIVPNVFCDDDTINIRVPLDAENASRKDVQFLCAKYDNTYAIYGIQYDWIAGGLDFIDNCKRKPNNLRYFMPKGKETIVYSIIGSLRSACETDSDKEVYKKTLSKIPRLFERGKIGPTENCFTALLVPYGEPDFYKCKEAYKQYICEYESSILTQISADGLKISKWKNESNMFSIISKSYPDAIYQYHASWLGQQSLDVYIPSLKIGFEYQGEQHFHPVEFFGGTSAFEELAKRDARKAELCKQNGITLIYWNYDEIISADRLEKKISFAKL